LASAALEFSRQYVRCVPVAAAFSFSDSSNCLAAPRREKKFCAPAEVPGSGFFAPKPPNIFELLVDGAVAVASPAGVAGVAVSGFFVPKPPNKFELEDGPALGTSPAGLEVTGASGFFAPKPPNRFELDGAALAESPEEFGTGASVFFMGKLPKRFELVDGVVLGGSVDDGALGAGNMVACLGASSGFLAPK
jgi:hypothetical protein